MSVPTLVAVGTHDQGTGAVVPAWPTHQADDVGILVVQSNNEAIATPAGWTECPSSPQGVGTAGAIGATRIAAFWKRATSGAEAAPTVADTGDHTRARIIVFRGCETSGSPFDTSAGGTVASASTAVSITGGTTSVAECLILAMVANGTDASNNQTTAGGWANADLTNVTRITSGNTTIGNGGGVDAATGEKATAGAFGATTATLATASLQGFIMLALKPPAGAPPPPAGVTEGGIYAATGVKATAGSVSATTATLDTAAVQACITIALKPPAAPPANLPPVVAGIPALVGAVGKPVVFPITASDPEGATLTYSLVAGASSVPSGAALVEDEGSGNFNFEWTPTSGQTGEWFFFVRVTDGTNTVDTSVQITVIAEPDTTLLELARSIAERAAADAAAANALAELLDETQQMNARVIHEVRQLQADIQETKDYMDSIIEDLEEETEPT